RLAGSNLSLEQPMHRVRARHVVGDLFDHPCLSGGQCVRKAIDESTREWPVRVVLDSNGLVDLEILLAGESDLEAEELVEDEPAPGDVGFLALLREVDRRDGGVTVYQADPIENLGIDHVADRPG
ncbi:MAG: hypothetical protein GWO04_08915, partial [Actinobacteria bacterium]|nr:hypothetical protein [Actinomycetota bacterium]